ncbi:Na+-translocating ferredoxin:NAD+ oxidoreductase RnfC subunit [Lysobacter niastensis]|uniref:Na+-translocating ferredoxin:NAD+ oxidoreductase RnfC subunit n=1 Tax=Lysobacter niastensis TaxID=380629 RepID=A0ABU1W937_9GAMM|nr:Na+-translocating ferredoxin:NAD+ oxidoreductase RnfC subunit [Lysobacter niastensis]
MPNCLCGCRSPQGAAAHAIVAALAADDLDRAIELGLLENVACEGCDASCRSRLLEAREVRLTALAARERHRAREARLQRRQAERDRQRQTARPAAPSAGSDTGTGVTEPARPALPSAAAAALARARAKAAERHKP